jgi:hypothetical protein
MKKLLLLLLVSASSAIATEVEVRNATGVHLQLSSSGYGRAYIIPPGSLQLDIPVATWSVTCTNFGVWTSTFGS